VPTVSLPTSPLAPGVSPVSIHYRDIGHGVPPLVILHGGWGYDIYAFDRQIAALSGSHRIVIPDRTGYGGSGRLAAQEADFHDRAAGETFALLDALGLERPIVWGHSDGAVIAFKMGLSRPERLTALIVEAAHLHRSKPKSREFFETMMNNPDGLGERVAGILATEHGDSWRDLIRINGVAWLRIADEQSGPDDDLYGGRLSQLRVPTLIVHGAKDPRTEPGELEAIRAAVPDARVAVIAEGGHSPHNERLAADAVTRAVERFLADISANVDATRRR